MADTSTSHSTGGSDVSWLLSSTVGKAATVYVDLLCGVLSKAFTYCDGGDDE